MRRSLRLSLLALCIGLIGGQVALSVPPVAVLAATNTLTVNPGAMTLTQALGQASMGTVIQVNPGSYTSETGEIFPLIVPPGVTVVGNESTKGEGIVISGGGKFLSPTVAGQSVAIVASKGSKISGLTVTNINKRGYGIWIEGGNALVTRNTLTGSNNDGIMVTGESTAVISNNYFYKNNSNGITILRTAQPQIKDNLFVATGFAINVDDKATPLVTDNIIRQCVDGAVVLNKARPIFRGNRFERNQRSAIAIADEAFPDIGTEADPGRNQFLGNGITDINNAKRSKEAVSAYGNQYLKQRNSGNVLAEIEPAMVPADVIREMEAASPPPPPKPAPVLVKGKPPGKTPGKTKSTPKPVPPKILVKTPTPTPVKIEPKIEPKIEQKIEPKSAPSTPVVIAKVDPSPLNTPLPPPPTTLPPPPVEVSATPVKDPGTATPSPTPGMASRYYVFVTEPNPDLARLKSLVSGTMPRTWEGKEVTQVGVFGTKKNADQLVETLIQQGFSAVVANF